MERQFNGQQKKDKKDYPRRLIPTKKHEITVLSLFDKIIIIIIIMTIIAIKKYFILRG